MRMLNKIINKVGADRVLNLVVGAVLNALIYPFGKELTIVGIFAVFLLSCVNELFDSFEDGNKCDWIDVLAGTLGAALMCGYFYIV